MTEVRRSQCVRMHELRKNLSQLLDALEEEGREIVVTRQGKPVAVIVDLEMYLEMQQALREFSDPTYIESLFESRSEIRAGEGIVVEEVFDERGL